MPVFRVSIDAGSIPCPVQRSSKEGLTYSLRNQIMRGEHKKKIVTNKVLIDTKKINEFVKNLSYKLTADQLQAIRDIILDMNQQSYMYSFLRLCYL